MLGSAGDYRIWSYLDVTDTIKVITLRTETVDCKTWQGVSEKQPKKIFPFFDFNVYDKTCEAWKSWKQQV